MRKIVDDLTLYLRNQYFNIDSNFTLTQQRSKDRWSWIREGSVTYTIHIGFVDLVGTRDYTALTEIAFELTTVPDILPVDFRTKEIYSLVVNGQKSTPWLVGEYLMVPRIYLVEGVNNIGVHYKGELDNDGLGLCMYIDETEATDKYYTYSQF